MKRGFRETGGIDLAVKSLTLPGAALAAEKKAADAEKGKRKPPTLYRKGELEKKDEEKKGQ